MSSPVHGSPSRLFQPEAFQLLSPTSGICDFLAAAKIKLESLGMKIGNTRMAINGNRLVSIFSALRVRELKALSIEDLLRQSRETRS